MQCVSNVSQVHSGPKIHWRTKGSPSHLASISLASSIDFGTIPGANRMGHFEGMFAGAERWAFGLLVEAHRKLVGQRFVVILLLGWHGQWRPKRVWILGARRESPSIGGHDWVWPKHVRRRPGHICRYCWSSFWTFFGSQQIHPSCQPQTVTSEVPMFCIHRQSFGKTSNGSRWWMDCAWSNIWEDAKYNHPRWMDVLVPLWHFKWCLVHAEGHCEFCHIVSEFSLMPWHREGISQKPIAILSDHHPGSCMVEHISPGRRHQYDIEANDRSIEPKQLFGWSHDTETAKHIFWDCPQWSFIRTNYPVLLRLYTLVGTQWPSCYLHCGWIERERNYGFMLLDDVSYNHRTFITETHQMFLQILLARYEATQVFTSTPLTPPNIHFPEIISSSSNHTPTNVQIRGDVSPISPISICSSEHD